jgi:hypothetical protein
MACHSSNSEKPDAQQQGGDDDAAIDAQLGDFAVAVDQPAVAAAFGTTTVTNLTVTRDMLTGDIAMTARDLPAGVTVTFEPATLSAGTDTTVVTIGVMAGAPVGTSQITLVATAGTLEHTTTVDLTVLTMTVSGLIAHKASGVVVGLVGKTSTTSTAGGVFTFTDVTPPYDLYTVSSLLGTTYVTYYKGLTRSDPVVTAAHGITATVGSSTTISGTMTGRTTALNVQLIWSDSGAAYGTDGAGNYSFTASWPSASTRAGTLYGLEWVSGPDLIKYGSTNATVSAGGTNTVNVTVAAATTGILNGSFTAPATFHDPHFTVSQQVGKQAITWQQSFFNGVIDCKIPIIPAGKTSVVAFSDNEAGSVNDTYETTYYVRPELAATTDVSFALPPPATLSTPAAAATGVSATTDFTFTAPANTVYAVNMTTAGTTKVSYTVYTTSTTARIPVVTEVALPAAQSFKWSVNGHGPHATVDDIATMIGPEVGTDGISAPDLTGPAYTYTTSAKRTFTSQ